MKVRQTTNEVIEALRKSGYTDTKIDLAIFWGTNEAGQAVHKIFFEDEDYDRVGEGFVYIKDGRGEY